MKRHLERIFVEDAEFIGNKMEKDQSMVKTPNPTPEPVITASPVEVPETPSPTPAVVSIVYMKERLYLYFLLLFI